MKAWRSRQQLGSSPPLPEDTVETIGLSHLIVARKAVSEAIAANLTRQLFADRQSLLNELPGVATLEKPDTDKDASVPVHPGAAADIDGTEQTFVEKYSDYFWGALLLFSGIGSAGAWFRAFIKRDEKAKHLCSRSIAGSDYRHEDRGVHRRARADGERGRRYRARNPDLP